MAKHLFTIVDENDNPIGAKTKEGMTLQDINRVAALWITNSQGDILLAKRHKRKKLHPGLWGPAAAGTVEQGETYESNIIKEAEEEIGIRDLRLRPAFKVFLRESQLAFCQYFFAVTDAPLDSLTFKKDEVEEIRWVSREHFVEEITSHPERFTPNTVENFRRLLAEV